MKMPLAFCALSYAVISTTLQTRATLYQLEATRRIWHDQLEVRDGSDLAVDSVIKQPNRAYHLLDHNGVQAVLFQPSPIVLHAKTGAFRDGDVAVFIDGIDLVGVVGSVEARSGLHDLRDGRGPSR